MLCESRVPCPLIMWFFCLPSVIDYTGLAGRRVAQLLLSQHGRPFATAGMIASHLMPVSFCPFLPIPDTLDEYFEYDAEEFLVSLALLITEGRTPECSVKGRAESFHCPPAQSRHPGATQHECSDKLAQVSSGGFLHLRCGPGERCGRASHSLAAQWGAAPPHLPWAAWPCGYALISCAMESRFNSSTL